MSLEQEAASLPFCHARESGITSCIRLQFQALTQKLEMETETLFIYLVLKKSVNLIN